jgi:nicotinamide riboside kinase
MVSMPSNAAASTRQPAKHPLWVLLGAECTGKSTLARAWAQAHPSWQRVDEYLREFCDRAGRTPRQDEQAEIAAEQTRRIEQALQRGPVIADTHAFLTAVYSDVIFGDTALYVGAAQHLASAERVFICKADFNWRADGFQRDGAAMQAPVHKRLHAQLAFWGIDAEPLEGVVSSRLDVLAQKIANH